MPYELYTSESYDAVYLAEQSMQICGLDTNCIKDFLYSIKNWTGASGTFSLDKNGDAERTYVLKWITGDKVELYPPR